MVCDQLESFIGEDQAPQAAMSVAKREKSSGVSGTGTVPRCRTQNPQGSFPGAQRLQTAGGLLWASSLFLPSGLVWPHPFPGVVLAPN